MPDFQNPTGRTMSAQERAVFAAAADRSGTVVIVDETTSDIDIDRAEAPEPFGAEAPVVRLGSLGKTVWGGLRVGWVRAEADIIRRLVSARAVHDLGTPEIEQAIAEALIPRLDEIAVQRAQLLREGRDAVTAELRARLPQWQVPDVDGGVALWVELDAPLSSGLVMAARGEGLYLSAGSRFAVEGGYDRHLRVPFTAPSQTLVRAASILDRVWPTVHDGAAVTGMDRFDAVV
jgi:DNA-binding transcriptional MocR family regulator